MIKKLTLTISGVGLWILMMPADLYGLFGILVTIGITWKVSGCKLLEKAEIKGGFLLIPLILLLLYSVLLSNFYTRWIISGAVGSIAELLGISVSMLLYILCAILGIISVPFSVLSFMRIVRDLNDNERCVYRSRLEKKDVLFCCLAAMGFSALLYLAPWSDVYPGTDSTVFLYIGQQMKNGLVPYLDLFDHKGILLYGLEWLGAVLTPGAFVGIWIIEIINLFATALIILKIGKLFSSRTMPAYLTVLIVLATFKGYLAYEGGNLVEEYALPWIILALYYFIKYFQTQTYRLMDIVWIGISFMVVLLLRANMITVWVAFLPVVFVILLYKRKWKDIGRCVLGFAVGCVLVLIPVLFYTYTTHSFEAMWDCYIRFNLGYSESEGSFGANIRTAWFLMTISFAGLAIIVLTAFKFRKNYIWKLNIWYGFVSIVLISMSGRLYYHYGISLISILIVPTILLLDSLSIPQTKIYERLLWSLMVLAIGLYVGVSVVRYAPLEKDEMVNFIYENSEDSDNVLIIGNMCYGYLQSGRTTTNRFFYQTPPINISDDLCAEFIKELEADYPDMVIITDKKESWINQDDNKSRVSRLVDTWAQDGVYSCEVKDTFTAYILNE